MIPENPPNPAESGMTIWESISQLDRSKRVFFAKAYRYKRIPIGKSYDNLETAKFDMVDCFTESVETILKLEPDEDEARTLIIDLIIQEDTERVEALNRIAGAEVCERINEDGIQILSGGNLSLNTGSDEEYVDDSDEDNFFTDFFSNNVQRDYRDFVGYVGSRDRTRVLELGKNAGKHAADIGKLAAGVALGIHLARRVNR